MTFTSEDEIIEKITWQLPGGEWAGVGQGTIWLTLKKLKNKIKATMKISLRIRNIDKIIKNQDPLSKRLFRV